ncbi:phosphopantetheine-binding protein [Desulfobacterium sp. N47]|uniref:phosphopantetheine-binding protein n=1 Tax=Desulfobacterium sp. N47 TaxID=3115210 RepID=UPI003CA25651
MEEVNKMNPAGIRKLLKELLIESLSLEDIQPDEIADDEILFGEGLGLDSLDAVEIVVLLQRNFGLEVKDMKQGKEIFYSIETLARYVFENTGIPNTAS